MRHLLLALGQAARNGLAHIAELDDLMRDVGVNGSGLSHGSFRARSRIRSGGRNRAPAIARERVHICLHDTAIWTGAGD